MFEDNEAEVGGGLVLSQPRAQFVLSGCTIRNNHARSDGGGLFVVSNTQGIIENCLVTGNTATGIGSAIYLASAGEPLFKNFTVTRNPCEDCSSVVNVSSFPTFDSCIFFGNGSEEIGEFQEVTRPAPVTTITYSDVAGGWDGEGNIDADPKFVNPEVGDFLLLSDSPCIDSASMSGPKTDLDGNPRPRDVPDVGRDGPAAFDMGAYELQTPFLNSLGDLNLDGEIDILDLLILDRQWHTVSGVR